MIYRTLRSAKLLASEIKSGFVNTDQLYPGLNMNGELIDELEKIANRPGVYMFGYKAPETDISLLYIGQSTRIGDRILSSFWEKMKNKEWERIAQDRDIYAIVILTKSTVDAKILELILINKYEPPFNKDGIGCGYCSYEQCYYKANIALFTSPVITE